MKKYLKNTIYVAALLLAAVLCGMSFVSCAFFGEEERDIHTMFAGTGTLPPTPSATSATAPVTQSPVTQEQTADGTSPGSVTTALTEITTAPDTTPETTTPVEIVSYEYDVVTDSKDLGSTGSAKSTRTLRFPKLTGLADTSLQSTINSLLSQIADVEFTSRVTNVGEKLAEGVTVKYEVKKTEVTYMGNNLLSVRSSGEIKYSDEDTAEGFVYCNIINLSTGKDISVKKVYADFGSVMNLFTAGAFTQIAGEPNIASRVSLANMIEQYKHYALYGTFPETYFTATTLVIVVELAEQYGYTAEFSIPLMTVNDVLLLSPTK